MLFQVGFCYETRVTNLTVKWFLYWFFHFINNSLSQCTDDYWLSRQKKTTGNRKLKRVVIVMKIVITNLKLSTNKSRNLSFVVSNNNFGNSRNFRFYTTQNQNLVKITRYVHVFTRLLYHSLWLQTDYYIFTCDYMGYLMY